MIPIVDVTGTYIFGFGSRSAAIGSLTRGISPLQTSKLITILNNSKLRFDVGSIIYSPKIISTKFYRDTELFKTTSTILSKLVSIIKYPYVFGDNPSMDIVRSNFYGISLPVIGNITYTSLNKPLDTIAFSFCGPGEVLSVKFYRDTELFKTSTIKAISPFTMEKGFRDVFGGTSAIIPPVIVSITDSRYTTTFNYGSGMNSSYLANILTTLSTDYTNTPFTGMRIVKIYSALPPGWQQTDQQPTKILIQFWS